MHHPLVLLLRRPLILSAHQLIVVSSLVVLLLRHPLVLSSRQLVVALSLLVSPSLPLITPAGISLCATLSSSHCAALSPCQLDVALPPSNTAATIERHRTPSNAIKCHRHRRHCPHRCHHHCCCHCRPLSLPLHHLHCQRKRQQHHHHQRANNSTNVKTFTSPTTWTFFTFYLQC